MTVRDDIRIHFEREALRAPVPSGLRATAAAEARRRASERPSHQWVPALVAIVLAVAIVAGLLAVNVARTKPVPVVPPRALFHDNFSAPATGRPSLTDRADLVHIQSYDLAASLPASPGHRNVYAIDRAVGPSPEAVAEAFGLKGTPRHDSGSYTSGLQYYPDSGDIHFYTDPFGRYGAVPGKLARPIRSEADVIPLAGAFLVSRGLFSQGEVDSMFASKRRVIAPTNPPLWFIEFDRTVGGLRDYGPTQPGALLEALDDGTLWSIEVMRHPVRGSESAPVISAAQAWAEVTKGHWYAADGLIDTGQIDLPLFKADSIELCYREGDVQEAQAWLVPMWCFTDTTTLVGATLRLYYPALVPGTFDWSVPMR